MGLHLSNVFSEPPIIIDNVPLKAPGRLPLTGASIISIPLELSFCAMFRVTLGEIVLISITTDPELAP